MQGVENATTGKTFVNCQMETWLERRIRLESAKLGISKGEFMRRAAAAYLGLEQEAKGGRHATA